MHSLKRLKSVYMFCRSASNTWDLHELNVAKLGSDLLSKLKELRLQQDTINQVNRPSLSYDVYY